MPRARISDTEVKELRKKAGRLIKLYGGKTKLRKGAGVSFQVIDRLMGSCNIEVEKADRIKAFLTENGI